MGLGFGWCPRASRQKSRHPEEQQLTTAADTHTHTHKSRHASPDSIKSNEALNPFSKLAPQLETRMSPRSRRTLYRLKEAIMETPNKIHSYLNSPGPKPQPLNRQTPLKQQKPVCLPLDYMWVVF